MTQLEEAISHAFPAINAPEDACVKLADVPVDAHLLEVTPVPPTIPAEELEEEVLRHRRLLVHGEQGIPISAIIAIGGALLIHAFLIGLFFLGLFFVAAPRVHAGGTSASAADAGGSGSGYMLRGDGPLGDAALAGKVPDLVSKPAEPILTKLPGELTKPQDIAAEQVTPPAENPLIGMPTGPDALGQIKHHLPDTPKPVETATIAPPIPPKENALASPGKTGPIAQSPNGGIGDGGDEADEPVIDIMRPGKGGEGSGRGTGHGSGLDRGESGANRASPIVINAPEFKFPFNALSVPKHKLILEVEVLPTGRAGEITVKQSCGVPEADLAFKNQVRDEYGFQPAFRGGRAVKATIQVGLSFGSDQ